MITSTARQEAWRLLDGEGAILETARDVTRVLRAHGIAGAVIGGVAVGLHGHVRATADVDVFVPSPLEQFAEALRAAGYTYRSAARDFERGGIVVQLVTSAQTGNATPRVVEIDGVQTVALADLVSMKLRSGMTSIVRAQDIADVIGLIRVRRLGESFAPRLARGVRGEFRRLVKAVRADK